MSSPPPSLGKSSHPFDTLSGWVDVAGFHLEMCFVQRTSWCLAIVHVCSSYILLCARIHVRDLMSLVRQQSVCLVGTLRAPWLLSSCSLEVLVELASVVSSSDSTVRAVWFIVGDFVDVRGVCSCETCFFDLSSVVNHVKPEYV